MKRSKEQKKLHIDTNTQQQSKNTATKGHHTKRFYHNLIYNIRESINSLNWSIICIYCVIIFETLASAMIYPILPALNRSLNLSTYTIGYVSSLSSLIVIFCGVIQGKASDNYGKLAVLKLSNFSQIISYLCLYIAIKYKSSYSFPLYVFSRIISSIFKCGMIIAQAYIIDSSECSNKSALRITNLFAISNLSFVVGTFASGQLSNAFDSIIFPIKISCIICMISFIILCFQPNSKRFDLKSPRKLSLLKPSSSLSPTSIFTPSSRVQSISNFKLSSENLNNLSKAEDINMASNNERLRSIFTIDLKEALILKFIFQLGNMMYDTFYAQFLHDRIHLDSKSIGILYSLSGTASAITNAFAIPYLNKSFLPNEVLITVSIIQAIGLFLWGYSKSIFTVVISTLIVSMSSNIFLSVCQVCIAKSPSCEKHGTGLTLSLSSTTDRAAKSIAPIIASACIHQISSYTSSMSLGFFSSSCALLCSTILISYSEPALSYFTTQINSFINVKCDSVSILSISVLSGFYWNAYSNIFNNIFNTTGAINTTTRMNMNNQMNVHRSPSGNGLNLMKDYGSLMINQQDLLSTTRP